MMSKPVRGLGAGGGGGEPPYFALTAGLIENDVPSGEKRAAIGFRGAGLLGLRAP